MKLGDLLTDKISRFSGVGPTQAELDAWVNRVEEIKGRDYHLVSVCELVNARGQTVMVGRLVHAVTGEPWKCPEFRGLPPK